MPPPLSVSGLTDKALYWRIGEGALARDARGEIQVHRPVELDVRWETNRSESASTLAEGATVAFEAAVVVPREVTVNSLMWLGGFEDWYGTGTAGTDAGLGGDLMQVKGYSETPNTKGRDRRRVAKLVRYKGGLPAVLED